MTKTSVSLHEFSTSDQCYTRYTGTIVNIRIAIIESVGNLIAFRVPKMLHEQYNIYTRAQPEIPIAFFSASRIENAYTPSLVAFRTAASRLTENRATKNRRPIYVWWLYRAADFSSLLAQLCSWCAWLTLRLLNLVRMNEPQWSVTRVNIWLCVFWLLRQLGVEHLVTPISTINRRNSIWKTKLDIIDMAIWDMNGLSFLSMKHS